MKMVQLVLGICCFATTLLAQQPEIPPPPGKLVAIGDRKLHLLCSGQGAPTILLEAGASSFAIDWTLVQRELQTSNRVCSYDRAGMGWSDPAPATGATDTADLHQLLATAGERPPYVMVGASRGGMLVRAYLAEHPADILGLVFVDPATEDNLWSMVNGRALLMASLTPEQLRSTLPKQTVAIPRRKPQTGRPFDQLPAELYRQRIALDERLIASGPETLTPEAIEALQTREVAFLARLLATRAAGTPFGDRPTVVLTRGDERSQGRESVHAALAKLSTNSRHSIIPGAGHEIHLFEPTAVTTAIQDVLQAIKNKAPLPARPE
jgi:pimeloyl-ACP methyl ester carboxylesterase